MWKWEAPYNVMWAKASTCSILCYQASKVRGCSVCPLHNLAKETPACVSGCLTDPFWL